MTVNTQTSPAPTANQTGDATTDIIRIEPWADPLIERLGHDPRSAYVEQFWLGILGPSTVWWLRHCAYHLDSEPEGTVIDLHDAASQLGVGHRGGRNSPLSRAIDRSVRFGAARPNGDLQLAVRRRLPPLNQGQVRRLPVRVQRSHQRFMEPDRAGSDCQRDRARRLALGLVHCGDALNDAELQLGTWRFAPEVAAEAVRWAWEVNQAANQK